MILNNVSNVRMIIGCKIIIKFVALLILYIQLNPIIVFLLLKICVNIQMIPVGINIIYQIDIVVENILIGMYHYKIANHYLILIVNKVTLPQLVIFVMTLTLLMIV